MDSYRNQYCIVDRNFSSDDLGIDLTEKEDFYDYVCFYDKNLKIIKKISENLSILLLGFIIDPQNPLNNGESVLNKLTEEADFQSFLDRVSYLSGRFILLVRDKNNKYCICSDACGLRQIYYYVNSVNQVSLSSFPELLLKINKLTPAIDEKTKKLISSNEFHNTEFAWYGDTWYDKRIRKILPNHYFNLSDKIIKRFPFITIDSFNQNKIIDQAIEILRNTYIALINRFDNLMQPLTAGWDSRVLLAASKDFKDKIHYYIFSDNFQNIPKEDIIIPSTLAKKLKLDFQVLELEELDETFINNFSKDKLFPRILPKTRNYYWHYKYSTKLNTININGNCAEITRNFYSHIFFSKDYFKSILYHTHFEEFFEESLINGKMIYCLIRIGQN